MQRTDHELTVGYQLDYRLLSSDVTPTNSTPPAERDTKEVGKYMVWELIHHRRVRGAKSSGHAHELVRAMEQTAEERSENVISHIGNRTTSLSATAA